MSIVGLSPNERSNEMEWVARLSKKKKKATEQASFLQNDMPKKPREGMAEEGRRLVCALMTTATELNGSS